MVYCVINSGFLRAKNRTLERTSEVLGGNYMLRVASRVQNCRILAYYAAWPQIYTACIYRTLSLMVKTGAFSFLLCDFLSL